MICRGWQDRRTDMGILKVAGKVLLIPLWFIISIIGAGVKLLVHMVAIAKKYWDLELWRCSLEQ